jgi:hypothetical protein
MIKVYRPFIFSECTVTGDNYFDKLEYWLMPQLQEHLGKVLVFQQDEVPLNVHYVDFQQRTLSGKWKTTGVAPQSHQTWHH